MAVAVLAAAPSAATAQDSLAVRGEVRVRSEATGEGVLSLLRTRVGLEVDVRPGARIFVQAQDARAFGEETSTLADGSADQLDLHQGFVELSGAGGGLPLTVRLGRQEVRWGAERLVGAVGWSNTGRAFDGAVARLGGERAGVSLLAATVAERDRLVTAAAPGRPDHVLLGALAQLGGAQAYVLHDRGDAYRAYTGVRRSTLGARWAGGIAGGLAGEVEGAYQTGSQDLDATRQEIDAWMATARIGRGPLTAGLDWLSGDPDDRDGTYGAFNTLYATNHLYYGFMDLFLDPAARTAGHGLVDVLVAGRARVGALEPRLALHRFLLARSRSGDRALGWEADLTLPVALPGGTEGLLGYSVYRGSRAAGALALPGDGELRGWGYAQVSVTF